MRACLVLIALFACSQIQGMTLVRDGRAAVGVTLAADASPVEEEAARELIHYLELATGASFELRRGGEAESGGSGIHVGSPGKAALLGPEEWVIMSSGDRLLLYGGRPRGTLYAVYRFLEEHVGVRWWTPREEFVPRLRQLDIPELLSRGEPAFGYRDIYGFGTEPGFAAHSRLNGHFSRVPVELGGCYRFGPPRHVHNFYDYVSPERYFESRPDLFSEQEGMRHAGQAQLCLTNPDLPGLVLEKLVRYIDESRGGQAPTLFSFSPNDWGGACVCSKCSALAESSGGQGGLLARFVNQLADAIRDDYPEILIDTLAYGYTMPPPGEIKLRDNVVVRFSALQNRKMSRPLDDPVNRIAREALEGWLAATSHLIVWDYAVSYGPDGDMPLANLPLLADDFRGYLASGVEGIFLQQDFPVGADMRALKLWVLAKLMEDPHRDLELLVEQFTDGYFGAAGKRVRRYLLLLERAMQKHSPEIGYGSSAVEYIHLDSRFLRRAQAIFDGAEKAIAGDALLLRRLRHARLSLDRATLLLSPESKGVAERYRNTWRTEIMRVYPASERAALLEDVERELSVLLSHRYNRQSIAIEDRP
jgi:hypothetical protein